MKKKNKGWRREPVRHAMASKGVKTSFKSKGYNVSKESKKSIKALLRTLDEDIVDNDLQIYYDTMLVGVPEDVEITSYEEAKPYEEVVMWLGTFGDRSVGVESIPLSPPCKSKEELASWWIHHRQSFLYWLENEQYDKIDTVIDREEKKFHEDINE